jgi:5'-3' exoribonuclease 1
VITRFEVDSNCSEINYPYTPFQQLLSIMPSRSAKLMPTAYSSIIDGVLNKYFPADFELDLNGRTLPWEAACLIPFCDEKLFLDTETELLKSV